MKYLLDANVLIQAKNEFCAFDICPGFWEWLDRAHSQGKIFSVKKVQEELLEGNDDLALWAHARSSLFLSPDEPVVSAFPRVTGWVEQENFSPAARYAFLQGADFYLVAHALAHGFTVVTHEKPSSSRRKVKIPNVCQGLGIPYVDIYTVLRREGVRFVLS